MSSGGDFIKIKKELVIKAAEGDKNAFSDIYYSFYKNLYNYAVYILGNGEDAADAVSDTFVEIWKGIKKLRNPEAFEAWAFKILNIRCKKEISNRIKRRGEKDFDALTENPCFGSENIEEDILKNVDFALAFSKLEEEEKMILVLSVLYGYTHREIAEMIGKPISTVGSKLYRAYKKLKKQMTEE